MPQVSRHGDKCFTGHACDTTAPVIASQFTVLANAIPVLRPGDKVAPHEILRGRFCVFHKAEVNAGSSTVFAQGIPVARLGDSTDKGAMKQGSPNVFAGG
jgi:uncharacterized Zn-binding protein involved in type VI secretion